jgi:hypothetical protein
MVEHKTGLRSGEMKFLMNIAGYRGTDHKRNDEIREELNIFELNDKSYRLQKHGYPPY